MFRTAIHITYKLAKRIVVAVVGISVLLIGIAMIVLPGPALLVIPVGLAILGAEFAWARHWLHTLNRKTKEAINGLNNLRCKSKPSPAEEN